MIDSGINSHKNPKSNKNPRRIRQNDLRVIRWLLQLFTRKVLCAISVMIIVQLLLGVSGVCNALLLRSIVDNAISKNNRAFLIAAVGFAILVLMQITGRAVCRYLKEYSRSTCENLLKEQEYRWLMEKSYEEVTATHTGEWMNRLTSDTVVVADGMAEILPGIAFTAAKLISASITLIMLLPPILFIVLIAGGSFIFVSGYFRRVLKEMHKRIQEADGSLRVTMQEQLESMLVIKAFSQEETAAAQVRQKMARHRDARLRRSNVSNFFNIGYALLMRGAYVLGGLFCGYCILTDRMTYGTFTAVLQLINQVQNPVANASSYLPRYYTMIASAERLQEASQLSDSVQPAKISQALQPMSPMEFPFNEICLNDITFRYLERGNGSKDRGDVVLSHFSCRILSGDYIELIGPSGCGKSTVLKILMCLYAQESGSRTIDGKPLETRCRGLFAYVPQGNQLMSGTIREVLTFGNREQMQQDDQMWKALKIACAESFVREELPDGLDTTLGEHGTGLSEGQIQRLAIARAIFSGYPILLLDEATSSLDAETEKKLLENLRAMTDRTVLIVTHRPMALQMTDRVLDLGKAVR